MNESQLWDNWDWLRLRANWFSFFSFLFAASLSASILVRFGEIGRQAKHGSWGRSTVLIEWFLIERTPTRRHFCRKSEERRSGRTWLGIFELKQLGFAIHLKHVGLHLRKLSLLSVHEICPNRGHSKGSNLSENSHDLTWGRMQILPHFCQSFTCAPESFSVHSLQDPFFQLVVALAQLHLVREITGRGVQKEGNINCFMYVFQLTPGWWRPIAQLGTRPTAAEAKKVVVQSLPWFSIWRKASLRATGPRAPGTWCQHMGQSQKACSSF